MWNGDGDEAWSGLTRSSPQRRIDVGAGEDGGDRDAGSFDGFFAAFAAVHQNEGEGDDAAFGANFVDSFQSGTAGGDGVIDDDDGIAGFEVAFDKSAAAVSFG